MASLTQTAIVTRKAVRYSIYGIIILIIGRIALGILISLAQTLFPAPPPPPTVAFGKLPGISFPSNTDIPKFQYTIQTPEGGLPAFTTQAKVYFMPSSKPDLLALDNAKSEASALGFGTNPVQISPTVYKFTNTQSSSTMEVNIVNKTFSLGYNLNSDPTPLSQLPPSPSDAATDARNFLTRASVLPDDLTGPTTQEYLKVQNKQLLSAISLSEANLIRINLFRKDYDKLPSMTANPNQANVWFIISGNQDTTKQVIGAQFYYFPVDETQFSTYPIKTSDQAFKDLQAGKGYIANLGSNNSGKITIRRVYLAYYDPNVQSQFYQPIVVFEGDNGFVAYVPAVTSTYYSQ